ncbi:MAG: hypothetical protein E7390_09270 [Ruminococcaceae bacterium]|nr:hypothetical protein [Oscillospiraceae bacterium]
MGVKKFDHRQFESFCKDLYTFGYEDGAEAGKQSVPGIDLNKVLEVVSKTKGIGPKKLEEISEALNQAIKNGTV